MKKNLKKFCFCFCLILMTFTQASFATALSDTSEVRIGNRHMVLIQADLENIWGSYYFAVVNNSNEQKRVKVEIGIPKEVSDFRAQEGLNDSDLQLDENGVVYLEKEFPKGMHLMAVGFQIKLYSMQQPRMTFKALYDMPEFSVAIMRGSQLKLSSDDKMKEGVPLMLAGSEFSGLISQQTISKGESITVFVEGIPTGREWYWILGGGVGILIALLAALLTIITKTKEQNTVGVH